MNHNSKITANRLKDLPKNSGVYLMKDKDDNIIYVGKAKNLKNRINSYFREKKDLEVKTKILVKNIDNFDFIITNTEKEALILENNLIKKYNPKFNIRLKDDKTYPYIKITNEKFPRLKKVREIKNDGARYYGPYTSATNVNRTIDVLNKIYPIRKCSKNMNKLYAKPSIYFHINQCLAPCVNKSIITEYNKSVDEIANFLEKGSNKLVETLKEKMKVESKALNFEKAAIIRDQINSIESLKEKQNMTKLQTEEMDIISAYTDGNLAYVVVFFIRNHKLFEREKYLFESVNNETTSKIIEQFVLQFYGATAYIPKLIEIMEEFEGIEVFEEFLSEKKSAKVKIHCPKKGEKKNLISLAKDNAKTYLEKITTEQNKIIKQKTMVLKELKNLLSLDKMPNRIEMYDISNIAGSYSVGSMVTYIDGEKKSSEYRKFKIKSTDQIDDYGSIMEVIFRRHKRGLSEDKKFSVFADLVIIDGGKGHVNSAKEALSALKLDNINVAGLVKDDKHRTRAIYYNEKTIPLDKHSELFKFLSGIQEEVHRFAITYHKTLRTKGMLTSILDEIKGVGKVRKQNLLKDFGSIENIAKANRYELEKTENITREVAENITREVAENIEEYFSNTK